jgi:hypothetical protein
VAGLRRHRARPQQGGSLKAGYRALGVDYTIGGFKVDAVLHGPVVGVGIRF